MQKYVKSFKPKYFLPGIFDHSPYLMPQGTQRQEQLFPRGWAAEGNNAGLIFSIQLHLSTWLQCLNAHQLYSFCHSLIRGNSYATGYCHI